MWCSLRRPLIWSSGHPPPQGRVIREKGGFKGKRELWRRKTGFDLPVKVDGPSYFERNGLRSPLKQLLNDLRFLDGNYYS